MYVVLASLADDSLLFPLLVVILYSSFRLCGTFLSLICQSHVTFFYDWVVNFMRNYTPPPAYNLATRPSLIYDMNGATPLLVHYHHIPYDSWMRKCIFSHYSLHPPKGGFQASIIGFSADQLLCILLCNTMSKLERASGHASIKFADLW